MRRHRHPSRSASERRPRPYPDRWIAHDAGSLPVGLAREVRPRINVLAGMDPMEKAVPQNGHISLVAGDRRRDFRVATLLAGLGQRDTPARHAPSDHAPLGCHASRWLEGLRSQSGHIAVVGGAAAKRGRLVLALLGQVEATRRKAQ